MPDTFCYLATVYSKHPNGLEAAFRMACEARARLVKAGVRVFAPIVHSHPVALAGGIDPYDHLIWLPDDAPFMQAASELIVYTSEGWEQSYGIAEEIKAFREASKPISFWDPIHPIPSWVHTNQQQAATARGGVWGTAVPEELRP